jgi:gas vesicle protein
MSRYPWRRTSVFSPGAFEMWEGHMALSRSDESRHDFAFIAGAVIGAIAGALVTLALTPMSGADTREKLRSRAGELGPIRERAMEAAAPVREKAGTLASTAAEKSKTLAATGKERAADLAAKAPIGRTHDGVDATDMSPEEAGSMLFGSQPGAHPGGTVTPGALADAGADAIDSSLPDTADGEPAAHSQDPAEGARAGAGETGNGRISSS